MTHMFIAIDIGGTRMRVSAVSSLRSPRMNARRVWSGFVRNRYESDFDRLVNAIESVSTGEIKGIGISIAGTVDVQKGRLIHSPNLRSWEQKPIVRDLARVFRCLVAIQNDAVCSALGESWYGKEKDFLFLTWGTGIGGTQIHRDGERVMVSAFEPGQQRERGGKKTWEKRCGGGVIRSRFKKEPENMTKAEWNALLLDFEEGLVNVLAIRPCSRLVLGGGVFLHHPKFIKDISRYLRGHARSFKTISIPRSVRIATFGEFSGLYGALAILAIPKHQYLFL